MAIKDYPDWVLKHKEKGTELRLINNKYYLYKVHTERKDGKVKKYTDKYLGRITEDGLIPPQNKIIKYSVKEYYSFVVIFNLCGSVISNIITRYPKRYNMYLSKSILDVLFNNDLILWERSYLSIFFPLDDKNHTQSVNEEIKRISNMMNHHLEKFFKTVSKDDLFSKLNDLMMVGVKDNYTLALYSDITKETLNKYKWSLNF